MDLTEAEAGYIACLLDTSASIQIGWHGKSYYPRIEFSSTHRDIIFFLEDNLPGCGYGASQGFRFLVTGQHNVLELLIAVSPYLKLKSEQAGLAMEFCKSRLSRDNRWDKKGYTQREVEIAEELRQLKGG